MTTLLLLTALISHPADTINLAWSPQKGEQATWSVTIKGKVGEREINASSSVTHLVTKCTKGSIVLKSTVQDALARTGADEGRLKRSEPTTYTLDARGAIVAIEGAQKEVAWRLAPFNRFVWPAGPVAIGDSWTADASGDGVLGRTAFKFASVDKGFAKITFDAASVAGDKTTKGQGFWLVDATSGRAVALHAEIQGLLAGPAVYEMTLLK